MGFTPGIQTINSLAADQLATNTIVLANMTGFTFTVGPNRSIKWALQGIFTTGATGGFRFRANTSVAAALYTATWAIDDVTTPAAFKAAQLAAADFTNASAVATNYIIEAAGFVTAPAAGTILSLQFAQNNATANPITLRAGLTLSVWQV